MGEKAQMQEEELAQFGSERNPFSENAEEIAFFPGGHRRQYLESLLHLTRFGRPIMVVSGQDGIGKTLLKEQFLAFVDESAFTVVELEPSLETEADFNTELCHQLGIRTAGLAREELGGVVLQFAEDLGLQAKTLAIVIDDAHELSDDALNAIFRLCQASEHRSCQLHFLLFGAQSLLELLEQDEYVGEFSAFGQSLLMDPLSEEETREYIHYRLESAGIPTIEFTRNQMQTIYLNSGGVPAEINRYARSFMDQPNIVKPRGISPRFQWIAGGAVAAMFAVGLFIARESSVSESTSVSPVAENGSAPIMNGAGDESSIALPPPLENKPVIDATSPSAPVAMTPAPVAEPEGADFAPASQQQAPSVASVAPAQVAPATVAPTKTVTEPAVAAKPAAIKPAPEKPVAAEKPAAVAGHSLAAAQKAGKAEPKPAVAAVKPAEPVKAESAKKVAAEAPAKPGAAAEKAIAEKAVAAKPVAGKADSKDQQWLLTRSPQKFTLQLLGAKDEAKVKSFIAQHKTAGDFAYFKTRNQNGDWYVVVTGEYASRDQAKAAIAQLPQDLQANKPWARSLQTVHEDIQKVK